MGIIEIHTGPHQATPAHTEPHRATPSQKNALYTHTEPHRATPPQKNGSRNTHTEPHRATPSHTNPEKSSGCVLIINMRNTHYLVSIKHHLSMINRL